MADYAIHDTTLTAIADAIRGKTGSQATIDVADFASEIGSIPAGGSCERLMYLRCVNNDQIEIPSASTLDEGTNYGTYLSYDSSTKKFTVLTDFTAIITCWVYTYQTYEASKSDGAFYVNGTQIIAYEAAGTAAGSIGGKYLSWNFKQGDTFNVYTPTRDGYPQQNCKVYKVGDVPDEVYTFADEEA